MTEKMNVIVMKFKNLGVLKKELGYTEHDWGINLKHSSGIGLVNDMFWMFDGKERTVEIYHEKRESICITIYNPEYKYNVSWQIHKKWIDNSPNSCYDDIENLFKEAL